MRKRATYLTLGLICLIALSYFGCSKNSTEPETTPPPKINVASINVQCGDGSDCIQFFARPDKDVIFVKVEITSPVGDKVTYNLNSSTVIKDESIALQDTDFAYFRISGEWKFVFTGNLATGDKSSFEVTSTVNVSA